MKKSNSTSAGVDTVTGLLRQNWRTVSAFGAICTDVIVVFASFAMASLLVYPYLTFSELLSSHFFLLALSTLAFVGIFTALGFYRIVHHATMKSQSLIGVRAYFYAVAIILCTLFLYQNTFYSRQFLFTFFALIPLLYTTAWMGFRFVWTQLKRLRVGRWNTLLVGSEPTMNNTLRRLGSLPELGYDVVKIVDTREGEHGTLHVNRTEIERSIREDGIEMIVLASSHLNGSFDDLSDLCRQYRIPLSVLSGESDSIFRRTHIHDLGGIPVLSHSGERIKSVKRVVKRTFDVIASLVLLTVLSPVFLFIAIATKIESRGPVLFTQERALSDRAVPFRLHKFRSMYHASDEIKESLVDENESDGALFKIRNDPRLTRIGRFIRRHSLDELPQLYNVLKGEMSLVGPRPLPTRDFVLLDQRDHLGGYFRNRGGAKPGMTGLWQVSGRSDLGFREMVLLDLYYIENQTLLFDLEILLRTIPAVLFGKGAY